MPNLKTIFCALLLCLGTSMLTAQIENQSSELIISISKAIPHKTNLVNALGLTDLPYEHITSLTSDGKTFLVSFDPEIVRLDEMERAIRASGKIHAVQPNRLLDLRSDPPNDNLVSEQWYLDVVNASDAWNLSKGGENLNGEEIVIAVIDNGFDLGHEDLTENIWKNTLEVLNDGIDNDGNGFIDDINGWNFTTSDGNLAKENHGTSVLGLVGAKGNNQIGITGMNWNVKLMPISIDNRLSSLLKAFDYVEKMRSRFNETNGQEGAFVVASTYSGGKSFEFAQNNPIWCDTYNALGEVGVLSIGATSNINMDVEVHGDMPSTCNSDYLIVVTSTDQLDSKLISAAYGAQSVDIGAPGVELLTTHVDNIYHTFSGTSAATPLVAGSIGLLYSIPNLEIAQQTVNDPAETAKLMKRYVLEGAKLIPDLRDRSVSGGRLDLANTIRFLSRATGSERLGLQIESLFPNPTTELINVTVNLSDLEMLHWNVTDASGKVILQQSELPVEFPELAKTLDTSSWPVGQYFLTVSQGNFLKSEKITVHR